MEKTPILAFGEPSLHMLSEPVNMDPPQLPATTIKRNGNTRAPIDLILSNQSL